MLVMILMVTDSVLFASLVLGSLVASVPLVQHLHLIRMVTRLVIHVCLFLFTFHFVLLFSHNNRSFSIFALQVPIAKQQIIAQVLMSVRRATMDISTIAQITSVHSVRPKRIIP